MFLNVFLCVRSHLIVKAWGRRETPHPPPCHRPWWASALHFGRQTLTGRRGPGWSTALYQVLGRRVFWFTWAADFVRVAGSAHMQRLVHFGDATSLPLTNWKQHCPPPMNLTALICHFHSVPARLSCLAQVLCAKCVGAMVELHMDRIRPSNLAHRTFAHALARLLTLRSMLGVAGGAARHLLA